ncbi:MAG: hypothetical protein M3O50_07520 [Myxococcota bacterium]|nr:hypothetical protein [Myxococcota bacterium]
MSNLSMGISPGRRDTRVIAMTGSNETILKARLSRRPSHPRALATLLVAVALWQGLQVRAALCATERDGVSDSSLYREAFANFGGPLYTLEWIPAAALSRRRHDIAGFGDFADLRQLMTEVAR